jgi:hypothetical protein
MRAISPGVPSPYKAVLSQLVVLQFLRLSQRNIIPFVTGECVGGTRPGFDAAEERAHLECAPEDLYREPA